MASRVRAGLLWVFGRVNPGDITIRHHWTGDPLHLHSFPHRGYWWHGRSREHETIEMFSALIQKGDIVWEVGAHIGYLTGIFGSLARHVTAFEPASGNLRYLNRNVPSNARIIPATATTEDTASVPLYVENLTGQNCSLLPDYNVFKINARNAGYSAGLGVELVSGMSLDSYALKSCEMPDFVKIDVEGAELEVLAGMKRILADKRPWLMVEITDREEEVVELLSLVGYKCTARFGPNTFWAKHREPKPGPNPWVPPESPLSSILKF